MSNLWKRSLSMLMAIVMVFGMLPAHAIAAELEEDETEPVIVETEPEVTEHSHDYSAAVTKPTCTDGGYTTYTCDCGDRYTADETNPLGHTFVEGTCACGATDPDYVAPEKEPEVEPEEEPEVEPEAEPEVEPEEEPTDAPAEPEHTCEFTSAVTDPTCTKAGYTTFTCTCGETYTADEVKALGHTFEEGICETCGEADPDYKEKAELSGETRKVYFYNVEGWDEVWAAWSFDEEDFDDVAHPGEALDAAAVLEDVYVVTVPVEADDVLFSDGIEVTDAVLEEEKLAGVEVTHEVEVELESDKKKDYFDGEGWLNYADEVAAVEAAKKAAEEAAAAEAAKKNEPPVMDKAPEPTADPVQALIESLPASVNSQEEYDAVYAVVNEIEEKGYDLTGEQMDAVFAAMNAADEWYNADIDAGMYDEPAPVADSIAAGWNSDYSVYTHHNTPKIADLQAAINTWGKNTNPKASTAMSGSALGRPVSYTRDIEWNTADIAVNAEISFNSNAYSHGGSLVATAVFNNYGLNVGLAKVYGNPTYTKSFILNIYDELKVTTVYDDGTKTEVIIPIYRNGNAVTVTVPEVEGYDVVVTGAQQNAQGVWVVSENGLNGDTEVTLAYAQKGAATHKVELNVVGDTYGSASLDASGDVAEGTPVKLTAAAFASDKTNVRNYLKSIEGIELDENNQFTVGGEDITITVTFEQEVLNVASSGYEIKINGFSNETKAVDLKELVLDEIFGKGNYNAADYKVELLTRYEVGEIKLGERYYNVEGETGKFLYWDYEIPASWFVTQLAVDGVTENNFKVTKLAASNQSGKDLSVEDVMFTADESRLAAEIKLTKTEFNVDQVSEVEALVKAAVQYKKDGEWTDIDDNDLTVSAITAAGKQTVTITVTKESADYLKNETGINPEIDVALNYYTVAFVDEDGTPIKSESLPYGAAITAPADPTKGDDVDANGIAKATYTFAGWKVNDEVVDVAATVTGAVTYTATYTKIVPKYTITWVNGNETTTTDVAYGDTPVAPTAVKAPALDDNGVEIETYVDGTWGTIAPVSGPATYTATFTAVPTKYTITWVNGNEITTTDVAYGETPVAPTAVKAPALDDNGVEIETYVDGTWGTIAPVSGPATYTATFTTVTTKYTITFVDKNGNAVADSITAEYGVEVTLPNATVVPTGYGFFGWQKDGADVTSRWTIAGNVTLTAHYELAVAMIVAEGKENVPYASVQDAIDAAENGDTIKLLQPCEDNVTIRQKEGVSITIDGNGMNYSGTMYIWGERRINCVETLTIQNVKFTTDKEMDFISSEEVDAPMGYAHNVTVKGCSFTATGAGVNKAVALRMRQAFDITVENCTATGLHSVMQSNGGFGLTVDGLNATNCKSGLNVNTTNPVTVKNSTIITTGDDGYGIRADGTGAYTLNVANCTISAFIPVLVRNTTAAYTLNVTGENTITADNAEGYQIALTNNKTDVVEEYEKPTGDFKLSVSDYSLNIFPAHEAAIGNVYYMSLLDALKAAKDNETVELLRDVELYTRLIFNLYTAGRNVTLDGNNHKLFASSTNWGTGNGKHLINVNCDNVTLKDITLDSNAIAEGANIYMAQNITFDNVTITNKKGGNADLTVNGSTLNVKTKLVASYVDVSLGKGVTTPLGITADAGAVLDVSTLHLASAGYPNSNLDDALATDGTSYYTYKKLDKNGMLAGYTNSLSRISDGYGLKMLESATGSSNVTLLNEGHIATFDLNGKTLTIAEGKALTVNGTLTVENAGAIEGKVVLGTVTASITAPAGWENVENGLDLYNVQYEEGKYFLGSKLTFVYGNGEPDAVGVFAAGATLTGFEEPKWADHKFMGWNPELVFPLELVGDATYTAVWAADVNNNGVEDEKEIITIKVTKANDADAVALSDNLIEMPLSTADAKTYVFDSTNPTITITATPVVTDGISSTYVKSVTGATLAYGENFVATANVAVMNGDVIEVIFEAVPVLKETPDVVEYNFFTKEIPYEDIYKSVVVAPELVGKNTTYTYFARPAMKHTVSIDALDLDSSIKTILKTALETFGGSEGFSFDMPELWLPLDAEIEESVSLETAVSTYLTKERLNGLLGIYNAAHDKAYDDYIAANGNSFLDKLAAEAAGIAAGGAAVWADIQAIYDVVYASAMYYGAHEFGYNADGAETVSEQIKIEYSDPSMKWSAAATVVLKDSRKVSVINGSDLTLTYRDFLDEDILKNFTLTDADGNPIEGKIYSVELTDPYTFEDKNVSETTYELIVKFAGNEDYRRAEKTVNVTVVKAKAAIDLPNLNITYGDSYDVHANISTGNKYGIKQELIDSLVEIYIGLDVADLDVNEDGQVTGAGAHVQIFVPKDDAIATIFKMAGLDIYGEEGEVIDFSQLQDILGNLDGLLGEFDSGNETVDGIMNVLESVTGLVDLSALKIKFGGQRPTDIGVYLYGAVSTSGNYETAYDVAYMLIKPQTTEYTLAWNAPINNGIITLPGWNTMDKGAHVVESGAERLEAKYLILGVNTDTSDIASTEIYENIRGNVWLNPSEITENGAYLQIAYGIDWGNKFEYAMPIVRGFAVVPALYDVQLVGENGTPNNELLKEFDNEPQGFSVIVKDDKGNVLYSDHYQNIVPLKDNAQLIVNYTGVQSNGQPYNGTEKPVHVGAYAATAIYLEFNDGEKIDISNLSEEDLYELFDLADIGMDMGLLVIEPAESTVTVEEKIVNYDAETDILFKDMVHAHSAVEGLKPDTTIISAGIDTDAAFSESGWDAVRGIVNVDFPAWMDALLDQYAPGVKAGMSVAELKDVLLNKLPDISDKLVELGATEEMVNSLTNLTGNVASVLAEMPDNIRLSFVDDAKANEIGAYIVTAVVTDSDHYPSVDAGYLVVVPDVDVFELKWNFEDGNGIFTRDLLDLNDVDLLAKAYDAKSGAYNEDATGKISYMFVGIDSNGKFEHYTDPATLPNGAYIELAYIELDVEGEMVVSDMIARPIVVVASNCKVNVENVETVFDNTAHGVKVTVTNLEGREIDTDNGTVTVLYAGVQTNGKAYMDTKAPVHAGVYEALVTYTETVDGELRYYGANAGYVLIDLAESNIDVTGETVTYDGNGHTATVVATGSGVTEPDYTLISGGVYVSGDIDEIGVDAFRGNVNIDLPTWMDKALAGYEFVDGINAAKVADYIEAYRDELIASIKLDKLVEWNVVTEEEAVATIAKLNAYIDELVAVLKKMPTDVALTFVDDITYTEPGAYFYYGIVTDSDHYPSTDTGLLVIEKMDMVYDLLDTTYAWDGTGKMVEINNPNNADALTLIIDRVNNTANFLIDNDAQYLLNTVARILGVEFDGDVQMSTILEKYNGAEVADAIVKMITEAEKLDLPEENAKALAAVKKQLQDLPADGTIVINGELPSEIGTYEVYAVSYSQYYKTNASEAKLVIVPAHFGDILVTDVTYNGTEQTGEVVVKTGDGQVVDPSEYIVTGNKGTNAGAYTVTVEGINHYEGTVTLTWNILPAEITSAEVTSTHTYNAAEQTATLVVKAGDLTLAETDYTVTGNTGLKEGAYKATVTGTGNYTGTADAEWKILPAEITSVEVVGEYTYNGKEQSVELLVKAGEMTVYAGDYKIIGNTATDAGEYTVTVTGIGNFAGVMDAKWNITKKAASITANDKTMVAGNPVPALDATVEGVIGEDKLNYTLSTKDPVAIGEHGTYEIVVTPGENPNYEVNWTNGNLIVQKCALTVDGVAYTSWAAAYEDIQDGAAEIKLYDNVRYANDKNNEPTQTKFAPNNDLTIDLNGYDLSFNGTITVNPNTKVNVVNGGSFTMEVAGWPLVLSNNNTLKMDESVVFTGAIQMNNKAKSDYYIGDECVIGKNSDALFQTTGDSNLVNVKFADGFMDLALQFGHLTLTKDLTTLDGQSVAIKDVRAADPGHLTIAKDVTLTLDPGTEITIANNSIVDGEGTIAVASAEHLALALSTDVANVKLVGSDEDTNIAMVEDGTVTLDLNKQSMKVGSLTVTGNMVIKDTASGDATPEAGKLLGTITVADGASLTLYAGTYSQDVQDYVADGYYAHDNGDGTWTVLKQIKLQSATDNTLRYYIGEAQGPEAADFRVVAENGDVLTADQFAVLAAQQTNAGTYTATILPNYRAYTGMVENVVWGILPAQITVTVDDVTIDVGDKIPAQDAADGDPKLTYTMTVDKPDVTGADLEALIAKLTDEVKVEITANVEQNDAEQNVVGTYENTVEYVESANYVVNVVKGNVIVKLGDYICWNTETGEYFDDVTKAFDDGDTASGHTIQMLKDATAENKKNEAIIIVDSGTTFDLNGFYVQTGNLLSFGVVMDGASDNGGIVISNDTTKAFTQLQPVNGGYLPIYDMNNGCYRFFEYTISSFAARNHAADASVPEDGVKFRFRLSFTKENAYKMLIDSDNTGLEMVVELSWTGLQNPILYTMDKNTLNSYATDAYEQIQASGKNTQVMYLTVRGLYNLASGDSMSATPIIQSITGAAGVSKTIPYSVS